MSIIHDKPFPHIIIDRWIPEELCLAAAVEWPQTTWPHWLKYSGDRGDKFVSHDRSNLTPACDLIVQRLAFIEANPYLLIKESFPDLTLYGAGMSMILSGGSLPLHLDSDHHPVTGWRRAASAIVYLTDCGGGELELWYPERTTAKVIAPKPGRLVVFECGDQAWHSVAPVTYGKRLSVSCFFWKLPAGEPVSRPRAKFANHE